MKAMKEKTFSKKDKMHIAIETVCLSSTRNTELNFSGIDLSLADEDTLALIKNLLFGKKSKIPEHFKICSIDLSNTNWIESKVNILEVLPPCSELILANNNLGFFSVQTIRRLFSNLNHLCKYNKNNEKVTTLNLSNNYLVRWFQNENHAAQLFLDWLIELENSIILDVENNNLGQMSLHESFMTILEKIFYCNLDKNYFSISQISSFQRARKEIKIAISHPVVLAVETALYRFDQVERKLDFSGIDLSAISKNLASWIKVEISKCITGYINELDLSNTWFAYNPLNLLKYLPVARKINLSNNALGNEYIGVLEDLFEWLIEYSPILQTLDLSNNNLARWFELEERENFIFLVKLAENPKFPTLRQLILRDNNLNELLAPEDFQCLIKFLIALSKMKSFYIDMRGNSLLRQQIVTLIHSGNKNLFKLNLDQCPDTETILEFIRPTQWQQEAIPLKSIQYLFFGKRADYGSSLPLSPNVSEALSQISTSGKSN